MTERQDRSSGQRARGGVVLRWFGAALVTGVTAVLALGFWIVGQGQYINDYCHTHAPEPTSPHPEALSGRPGYIDYLDNPVTVVCEYDQFPTVYVTDPAPLVGLVFVVAVVVGVAAMMVGWARGVRPA